ncbi:MAG: hypothetical protein IPG50_13775 [Myxococcales bacterium]|nr:hypothetical protein [Myxococcales bacterium]
MKVSVVLRFVLGVAAASLFACGGQATDAGSNTASEDALRGASIALGTYVVDGKPSSDFYLARLTILSDTRYEADLVQRGEPRISRGSYQIFPARPNNPDSPVASDKPWIALSAEGGGPSPNFEFDKLESGGLKMYSAARHESFNMKKDPSWRAEATNAKTMKCTGNLADAELVLDEAQNRAGTLKLRGKSGRIPTVTVSVFLVPESETGVRDWVRYEGRKGEQDFSIGIKKVDFERASGAATVSANYAENGQQFGVGFGSDQCSFE